MKLSTGKRKLKMGSESHVTKENFNLKKLTSTSISMCKIAFNVAGLISTFLIKDRYLLHYVFC